MRTQTRKLGNGTDPRAAVVLAFIVALVAACGGGGGGGGGSSGSDSSGNSPDTGDPAVDLVVTAALLARPVFDIDGNVVGLVSPISLLEVDPLTSVPLPGFPKPVQGGASINALTAINFQELFDPITPQIPVVARNAAIVVEFSRDIDESTLALSDLDPENPNLITAASPIQVRDKSNQLVPARAYLLDGNRVAIVGITSENIGFEPSPLAFDSSGDVVVDPTGHLRLQIGVGSSTLMSTDGLALLPDEFGIGSAAQPIPFNPGNSQLDAVVLQTDDGVVSFNGFLPDTTPPRIIRPVTLTGEITGLQFTVVGNQTFADLQDGRTDGGGDFVINPNTVANGGLGEWANSLMVLTTPGGVTSQYVVQENFDGALGIPTFRLAPGTVLDPANPVGSSYVITRTEYFEPIPPPLPSNPTALARITVDPENVPRDALDPEDFKNHDLRYFVRMFDEDGEELTDQWDPSADLFSPVPPKVQLRMLFSEPMDADSFRPYESFLVTTAATDKGEPGFTDMSIGQVTSANNGRELTFRPFLEDQFDPARSEFIGFGGVSKNLRLVVRVRPQLEDIVNIEENAAPADQAELDPSLGVRGVIAVTDVGGRSLGLPEAMVDPADPVHFLMRETSTGFGPFPPAADFEVFFTTLPDAADPEYGVLVHRFMGAPFVSNFVPDPGDVSDGNTEGIEYYDFPPLDEDDDSVIDRKFLYGPLLTDVGLNIPGFLTGASANTIFHTMDDQWISAPQPFSSPNTGDDNLLTAAFGVSVPLSSPFGARMQHVYRVGDASPSWNDYRGTVLDLVGLAWAPFNGVVQNTTIGDFEILVGLSNINNGNGPDTRETGGIPKNSKSGLGQQFDCNLLEWGGQTNNGSITCDPIDIGSLNPPEPPLTTVHTPSPYVIQANNLYTPPGTTNQYLNYPAFDAGIDLVFGRNVFSFPYSNQRTMLIEYRLHPQYEGLFNCAGPENPQSAPATGNFYSFAPGILSSALPRFRVFSQGQHPNARGAPNFTLGCQIPAANQLYRAGEGGPLLEPAANEYLLPPPQQPTPNWTAGDCTICLLPTCVGTACPRPNGNPVINWYYANGMLAYPIPDCSTFPGPTGQPPTTYLGYGCGDGNSPIAANNTNEPSYLVNPGQFGGNERYYMTFLYRKRVSVIDSPTVQVDGGQVRYLSPIIEPPLSSVPAAADLTVDFRSSAVLDFSVPALDSGFVPAEDVYDDLSGLTFDQQFVKFRASYGVAVNASAPPVLDTVIIPFEKVSP